MSVDLIGINRREMTISVACEASFVEKKAITINRTGR
jgi:hypothetical protein